MKKRKMLLVFMGALIIPSVLADYGHMMGYGYGMGSGILMGLYGIVWLALAVFIFSIIFWSTYKWIVKEEKKENKPSRR